MCKILEKGKYRNLFLDCHLSLCIFFIFIFVCADGKVIQEIVHTQFLTSFVFKTQFCSKLQQPPEADGCLLWDGNTHVIIKHRLCPRRNLLYFVNRIPAQ